MLKPVPFILFIILALINNVSAQETGMKIPKFTFGRVSADDFAAKAFGQDSAAAAIKIFDVGKGSFEISSSTGDFLYVFERHVRYKIINKTAYDLANLELQLFNNNIGAEEKLSSIKGASYNLIDGKIVASNIGSDAKFSSKFDKNHVIKKYTLPNVKEGSVIEFYYQTKSEFLFTIDDWYFQGNYPVKFSSFSLTVPEYYNYRINTGGYVDLKEAEQIVMPRSYYIPTTQRSMSGIVNTNTVTNQYYGYNIPSLKNENYITTIGDYVSKIGFELTSIHYPSSELKDLSSSWPRIVTAMLKNDNFGGFIRKENYDKNLLDKILGSETDPVKKMNLIFNYVKKNIKWNGVYAPFAQTINQKDVFAQKTGNSAEINLILMGLLYKAGLNCAPVLISTRENGSHPGYPLLTKFNNLIVIAEIDSAKHLLDATDKNNTIDLISYQNLNHKGLKLDLPNEKAVWIPIENKNLSRTNITYSVKLGTDNRMSGTLYLSSDNYAGLKRREAYLLAANETEFIKHYKINKPGLEISNYKISNIDSLEEPLDESMDITIDDNIEEAGNLSYFMPLLFERTKENPFLMEERKFPVDFAYPTEENYRIMIEFPANYKIEKLPVSARFNLPNNDGSFTITYSQDQNKIAVRSKINLTKSSYTADDYYDLKELFKNIVIKQAEQVVFKKI